MQHITKQKILVLTKSETLVETDMMTLDNVAAQHL